MNLRGKPSLLALITDTEYSPEYIRFYNFQICKDSRENKAQDHEAIQCYATELFYFRKHSCYDTVLYIYTSWHLGLTAAFSNKCTE